MKPVRLLLILALVAVPATALAQIPLGRMGTPEEVAACPRSHTGRFLKEYLRGN